jgi:RND family efflux transporter MFP subunit
MGKWALMIAALAALASASASAPAPAKNTATLPTPQTPAATAASAQGYVEEVFTQPSETVELAAAVGGIVKIVKADEGAVVKADDVILALDDATEQLALRATTLEAESDAEEQGARATMEQSQEEARITKQLSAEGAEAQLLYQQKRMAYDVALYKYELAKKNRQKAAVDAEAAKVALERKKVRAPVAGIVTRKPKGVGEAAQPLETVAHMVVIDPLHIIIHPPARMLGTFKVGQTLTVDVLEPQLQSVNTTVRIVNPVVDPASNTFRVRLALDNPNNRISSGVRVRVTVTGPESLKGP